MRSTFWGLSAAVVLSLAPGASVSSSEGSKTASRWPPSQPVEPYVQKGYKVERVWIWQESTDCLWNIAKEYYGNPYLWTKIYEANRHIIKDPNKIYPKQQIVIPPLEDSWSRNE